MKTIDDLLNVLDRLKDNLKSEMPNIAKGAALSIKALAEREIQDKGFGASYSQNAVSNQKLRQNILNNKGRDFLDKRDKQGARVTTYAEFRKAQGLQTGYVDLTYTGKMFAGMTVTNQNLEAGRYIAILGHSDLSGALKMDANYKRYGDFIAKVTDKQDINLVSNYVQDEILELIKQSFE